MKYLYRDICPPLLILLIALTFGCTTKKYTSDFIEYEGSLQGNYQDSDKMIETFHEVMNCMNIVEFDEPMALPNLEIRGCADFKDCNVNAVECSGFTKPVWGCYYSHNKTIVLPANVRSGTIEHEYVHYLCDMIPSLCPEDTNHESAYYLSCSGLKLE